MPHTVYREVNLPSGKALTVPVVQTRTTEDVANSAIPNVADLLDSVREFADLLKEAALRATPDSVELQFSIGFEVKTGRLTSMLVEGAGNAAVTLTMHWDHGDEAIR